MAQTIWKGWLSFGLVSIPVRLYQAVEEQAVRFRETDRGSGRRVRDRGVVESADEMPGEAAPGGGSAPPPEPDDIVGAPSGPGRGGQEDVSYEQVLKGYELPSGEMVTIEREDLEAIAPEQTRTIEIVEFVELADIDPIFF